MSHRFLRYTVLVINTLGLLLYLGWLVFSHERIFYTQEGVLFILPCLPFFFVFVFLTRGGKPPPEDE
jgi:hypothetical protein